MTTFFIFFQGSGNFLVGLMPMILIVGVFYILLIRPQQKRQRDLQAVISNLKAGDKIVTTGGIKGTIATVRETSLLIRSDKSVLEVTRASVVSLDEEEAK
jgi:preprotein translocase subunit YajC